MPNVSWEDIGGLDNVKRELQEVCYFSHLMDAYAASLFIDVLAVG